MLQLEDINQAKQVLEEESITYLDERIYEQEFNSIWKNVTPELRHVYEFLESNLLTPEYAGELLGHKWPSFWEHEVVFRMLYQYSEDLTYRTSFFYHG